MAIQETKVKFFGRVTEERILPIGHEEGISMKVMNGVTYIGSLRVVDQDTIELTIRKKDPFAKNIVDVYKVVEQRTYTGTEINQAGLYGPGPEIYWLDRLKGILMYGWVPDELIQMLPRGG